MELTQRFTLEIVSIKMVKSKRNHLCLIGSNGSDTVYAFILSLSLLHTLCLSLSLSSFSDSLFHSHFFCLVLHNHFELSLIVESGCLHIQSLFTHSCTPITLSIYHQIEITLPLKVNEYIHIHRLHAINLQGQSS